MEKLIAVARGLQKADLLLCGGRVVNVFTGEIRKTNVAVVQDKIAGVGDGYIEAGEVIHLDGHYLLPGFIDAHIHIESSMLTPVGFARAVLPHGTTAVISDPHEIVNATGLKGLAYMLKAGEKGPLDFFFMIPSCVPASSLETTGASLDEDETWGAFRLNPLSPGLGEMMNYPGVLGADQEVLGKLKIALGTDRLVDGHAPLLEEKELNAYIGAGISTDHETVSREEALLKIGLGMKVIIREGSAARDLKALLPAVNDKNYQEFMFGCDDRHPEQLLKEGEIDDILRKAVGAGLDPVLAVRLATINPARHYRLKERGAVAPGYRADLVVVRDLKSFEVLQVFKNGELVAQEGVCLKHFEQVHDSVLENTVQLPPLQGRFDLEAPSPEALANVMVLEPGKIITGWETVPAGRTTAADGINKVAVVERFGKNGGVSLGLVRGLGLNKGAIASTVAHDSHNLIVAGVSSADMLQAAEAVARTGGGMAVVLEGSLLAELSLPVGGLMSYAEAPAVVQAYRQVEEAARLLGSKLPSPFMSLSFLALPVIPALKITDKGLVDVQKFDFVPLWR